MLQPNNKIMYLPPPTGGINGRDALYGMGEQYCIDQLNIYPNYANSISRAGMLKLGNVQNSGVNGAGRLFALTTIAGVTTFLFTQTGGGNAYSISIAGVWASLGVAVGAELNFTIFKNKLFGAGGLATPYDWDGTTLTATLWTGGGLAINTLETPWAYKGRLYFTQRATFSAWYTTTIGAVTGALAELNLSAQFIKGGALYFGGCTNRTGVINDDLCVFVSNFGEVLVFSGDDPGASNWALVGRYFLASPISRYSFFNYGNDLHIITTQGIVAMSDVLAENKDGAQYVTISRLIDPLLTKYLKAVQLNPIGYSNTVRCAISAQENLLYFPLVRDERNLLPTSTTSGFWVMNLATKAWGWYTIPTGGGEAIVGCVSDSLYVYFLTGQPGAYTLYQTGRSSHSDSLGAVPWRIVHGFQNNRAMENKKFNKIRPIVKNGTNLAISMYADFDNTQQTCGTVTTTTAMNKKFYDMNKEASFIAVELAGTSGQNGSGNYSEYNGSFLTYQPGSDVP